MSHNFVKAFKSGKQKAVLWKADDKSDHGFEGFDEFRGNIALARFAPHVQSSFLEWDVME